MQTIGLTLGKFAPLHKGHQHLIQTALQETEHVIVVIYDAPDVTPIPLPVRAEWIRKLYPQVEVIEGWEGPTVMGDTPEIKKIQEEYILGLLKGRKITHFYSSEFYGDHMSKALGAINREVDRNRSAFPISGTLIRENPYMYKEFLSPVVYRDLILNVVFVGAPSTGKTTLAQALAQTFDTVWMPEYGREYWENNQVNRRLSLGQLLEIAEGHLEREEKLLYEANTYLFTDTNALTTYQFSLYYHGTAHPKLAEIAKSVERRYDIVFLCDTDVPYADTWDRSGDVNRMRFQQEVLKDLQQRKMPYIALRGSVAERIRKVTDILQTFKKYPA
jgi:NadR type nicotinamide-nucleotide adenylyltransferase